MSSITGDIVTTITHPATTLGKNQINMLANPKGCPCRTKALEQLKRTAPLDYNPRPIKDVNIGPHGQGVGHDEFTKDAMQIMYQVCAFIAFKDARYARKAISIQDVWNTQCMTFNGSNAPLEVAWGATCMVRGMEILKYTFKEWSSQFEARFNGFLSRIVMPNLLNRYIEIQKWNNNWILTIQEALLQIYLYQNNIQRANAIIQDFKASLPKCLVDDTGRCTETTRDLIHAQFQIGSILQVAEMCWHQGATGIYGLLSNRISKCMEYHAGILNGGCPANVTRNQLKDVWFMPSTWEVGYNHFVNRRKQNLPHTKLLLEKEKPKVNRPETMSFNWGPGWLHYNSC
jgi:hypothetical protein